MNWRIFHNYKFPKYQIILHTLLIIDLRFHLKAICSIMFLVSLESNQGFFQILTKVIIKAGLILKYPRSCYESTRETNKRRKFLTVFKFQLHWACLVYGVSFGICTFSLYRFIYVFRTSSSF